MTAEAGHATNRVYHDHSGNLHLNGASFLDANEVDAAALISIINATPASVTVTPAKGAANITLVTLQALDARGVAMTVPVLLDVWLSDAASGAGLTATTASGNVVAGTAGADFLDMVSKKAKIVQTDATGKYILSITDTALTLFVVCAAVRGLNPTLATLVTANYGP